MVSLSIFLFFRVRTDQCYISFIAMLAYWLASLAIVSLLDPFANHYHILSILMLYCGDELPFLQ